MSAENFLQRCFLFQNFVDWGRPRNSQTLLLLRLFEPLELTRVKGPEIPLAENSGGPAAVGRVSALRVNTLAFVKSDYFVEFDAAVRHLFLEALLLFADILVGEVLIRQTLHRLFSQEAFLLLNMLA